MFIYKIVYIGKTNFLQAKKMLLQHIPDAEIMRLTSMKIRTLTNLKNGLYDKYLNL